jgi:hypothetical protein
VLWITALFREINFAELPYFWGGINSAVKGGNELPHSTCEFRNSQEIECWILGVQALILSPFLFTT